MQATDPDGVSMEMPKYKCHKEVWALKIDRVEVDGTGASLVVEAPYQPRRVDAEFITKHDPQPGGYFVVYEDGYESFSPREAFKEGYTRL